MTDQPNALARVNEYFGNEVIQSRMTSVLGERGAGQYIASVLLVVANNVKLQECTPQSIYSAALQAATLRLSVDPSTGQAFIIPRKGKANFQIGYRGIYHMAMRTNRYRYINVGKVYEGETCEEDRLTGLHRLGGQKISNKIIGWIGAFEMLNGFAHTVYWTVEEIHAHAAKYSQSYQYPDSPWKTSPQRMEMKTVLTDLLKHWGYLDPADRSALEEIEEGQEKDQADDDRYDDAEDMEYTEPEPEPKRTEQEIINQLF